MTVVQWSCVAAGGAIGALLRVMLQIMLPGVQASWPLATIIANGLACFGLGALLPFVSSHNAFWVQPLLVGGICGAVSTFSTYILEISLLLDARRYGVALVYSVGLPVFGFMLLSLGHGLARILRAL